MPVTSVQAYSLLRPLKHLRANEAQEIYEETSRQVVAKMGEVSKANQWEVVVRGLRPSDLGETNDIWAETVTATGNAWENSQIANQSTRDDKVVGLYGVYDLSEYQAVTGVRILTAAANVKAEWDLFPLLTDDRRPEVRTGYAMSPVIIGPNINVTIQYYVRANSPAVIRGAEIILLGVVCERVGIVIQP